MTKLTLFTSPTPKQMKNGFFCWTLFVQKAILLTHYSYIGLPFNSPLFFIIFIDSSENFYDNANVR